MSGWGFGHPRGYHHGCARPYSHGYAHGYAHGRGHDLQSGISETSLKVCPMCRTALTVEEGQDHDIQPQTNAADDQN